MSSATPPTPCCNPNFPKSTVSAGSPSRAACDPRCGCGSIQPGSPPTAWRWRMSAPPSPPPTSTARKAASTAPGWRSRLAPTTSLVDASAYQNLVIAWRNGAPVRLSAVGSVVGGVENDRVAANYDGKPGRGARHPAPARRQHRTDRQGDPGRTAPAAQGDAVGHRHRRRHRPHRDHPCLCRRRPVHAGHVGDPGRAGDLRLPAQPSRHLHPRRGPAAVADRHLRHHAVAGLRPRQPVR